MSDQSNTKSARAGQDALRTEGANRTTASVPFMITAVMRTKLRAGGYDEAAIARMTPHDAWLAIGLLDELAEPTKEVPRAEPAPAPVQVRAPVTHTGTMSERDFVTVLVIQGATHANKKIHRDNPDRQLEKDGGVFSGVYRARQVAVPGGDPDAFTAVVASIAGDPRAVLMPGMFTGAGPDPFLVWPRKKICREILGVDPKTISEARLGEITTGWFEYQGERVIARLKANTLLSSLAMFDLDTVTDPNGKLAMPQDLADLSLEQKLEALAALLPTFAEAAKVIVPSTSSRILVNGQPWSSGGRGGYHVYFQVSDPEDLRNRVWPQLTIKGFGVNAPGTSCPISFVRCKHSSTIPGLVVGRVSWSIFDPCTLWPERLSFDGAPYSELPEITILPPVAPIMVPGGVVDVSAFVDLPPEAQKPAAKLGIRLATERREHRGVRVAMLFVNSHTLSQSHEVDTRDHGLMTVRAYWLSGHGKLPCQAPFRPSASWAGYLNVHADGVPFAFDTGADTKYLLTKADRIGPTPDEFMAGIKATVANQGGKIETQGQLEIFGRQVRNLGAAAVRHQIGDTARDMLLDQLAEFLVGPMGMAKGKILPNLRRDAKEGRKAALAATTEAVAEVDDESLKAQAITNLWLAARCELTGRRDRDGLAFSRTENGWIGRSRVDPDSRLITQLRAAADAPVDRHGRVSDAAIVRLAPSWIRTAWADLWQTLPWESEAAQEDLAQLLLALLASPYNSTLPAYKDTVGVMTQTLPLATWAYRYAKFRPGSWMRVRGGLFLWGRIDPDGVRLALKPGLANQLSRVHPEIAAMKPTKLTRQCRQAGLSLDDGNPGSNVFECDGQSVRATILLPSFVASLDLCIDDEDLLAKKAADLAAKLGPTVVDLPSRPRK